MLLSHTVWEVLAQPYEEENNYKKKIYIYIYKQFLLQKTLHSSN